MLAILYAIMVLLIDIIDYLKIMKLYKDIKSENGKYD